MVQLNGAEGAVSVSVRVCESVRETCLGRGACRSEGHG